MLRFLLKASRPGLWFPTLWLYLLPLGGRLLPHAPLFWLGLLYASCPLNLLIYGWNDVVDREIPWIARGPGVKPGSSLDMPMSTVDTAATTLAALSLPAPPHMLGAARLHFARAVR